jgi:hypothetical protein
MVRVLVAVKLRELLKEILLVGLKLSGVTEGVLLIDGM